MRLLPELCPATNEGASPRGTLTPLGAGRSLARPSQHVEGCGSAHPKLGLTWAFWVIQLLLQSVTVSPAGDHSLGWGATSGGGGRWGEQAGTTRDILIPSIWQLFLECFACAGNQARPQASGPDGRGRQSIQCAAPGPGPSAVCVWSPPTWGAVTLSRPGFEAPCAWAQSLQSLSCPPPLEIKWLVKPRLVFFF